MGRHRRSLEASRLRALLPRVSERPLPAVAALFDFDDTLCPDSTSRFLVARGVDLQVFWDGVTARVHDGYDYCLAYLDAFTSLVRPGQALDGLKGENLKAFGRTLVPYPEVTELLGDLRRLGEEKGVQVRLYVVSSGLREVIEASTVGPLVDAVYASELGADEAGSLCRVKRAVSFTEKTRYVFEVHKGLRWEDTRTNPLKVNKARLKVRSWRPSCSRWPSSSESRRASETARRPTLEPSGDSGTGE